MKIFYLWLILLSLSFFGSDCNNDPINPNPPRSSYGAKLYTETGGLYWEENTVFENNSIIGICSFSNKLNEFSVLLKPITKDYHRIMKTTDFGENWIETYSGNLIFNEIIRLASGKGFVVGELGLVLMTTDYGSSWAQIQTGSSKDMVSIDFADNDRGIMISNGTGASNEVYLTTNGGINWTLNETHFVSDTTINAVKFTNPPFLTAVACGHLGKILRTNDAGITWTSISSPTNSTLNSIDFENDLGVIVGDNGNIFRSEDGGYFWTSVNSASAYQLNKIYMEHGVNYWAVGGRGYVLKSTNQGLDWDVKFNNNSYIFYDALILQDAGFVVGHIY